MKSEIKHPLFFAYRFVTIKSKKNKKADLSKEPKSELIEDK